MNTAERVKTAAGSIVEQFTQHGLRASYHYADDTASGEWREAIAHQRNALKLFDANPGLQDEMRVIAKGFLWSLNVLRPQTEDEPEVSDEESREEIGRRENAILDRQ